MIKLRLLLLLPIFTLPSYFSHAIDFTNSIEADSKTLEASEFSASNFRPRHKFRHKRLPNCDLGSDGIQRIHAAVEENLGTGLATGYSVAIWRDGRIIYAEGFGSKNDRNEQVTPDTVFQIGSDTKKITAIALLQKVESGLVDLNSTVASIDPSFVLTQSPEAFDEITVHDLLSQRAGLYDYTAWFDASEDSALASFARGRFAENEHAMMPPGIAFNYSNANYYVAGYLTELLDTRPLADIMIEDIFQPLGLRHTYARNVDVLASESDIASGVGWGFPFDTFSLIELFDILEKQGSDISVLAPEEQVDNAFVRPAGLVWSTAADHARLLGFFLEGNEEVLTRPLREAMMSAQTEQTFVEGGTEGDSVAAYGYGLRVDDNYLATDGRNYAVPFISHGGNTVTMSSAALMLPEQRVAVSVLANGLSEQGVFRVAEAAIEAAAGSRFPAPTPPVSEFEPPLEDLSGYAGTYYDRNYGTVTITWDGDNLTIEIPLLTELGSDVEPLLVPIVRDQFEFTIDGVPDRIKFYDGVDGALHRYGVHRNFVLVRE